MDTILFFSFAAAYVVLLVWGLRLVARRGHTSLADLPLLVIAGLIYDNTVIASGRFIGEGDLLEALNLSRYWVHALVTPLLVVWAWHASRRSGAAWADTRVAAAVAWLITVGLVVFEIVSVIVPLQLEASVDQGVLTYSEADAPSGPPLMVLVVAAALLVAAITVLVKQKWVVLLIGTVLILIGSAVPIPIESGAVTNAFELLLLISIVWTVQRQDANERTARSAATSGVRPSAQRH